MNKAEIHFQLGYYLGEIGHNQEAIDYYQKAMHHRAGMIETHYNLGLIFSREGKFTEAAKNFQQVINLKKDHVKACFNLGLIYFKQEDYEKAIKSFQSAVNHEPQNSKIYYYLGLCYEKKSNFNNALHIYKLGIERCPDDILLSNNYGVLLIKNRNYREAIELFKDLSLKSPQDPIIYFNLALAFDLNNQKVEAGENYQKAIDLQPDFYEAIFNFATLNEDLNNLSRAKNYYLKAIKIKPDDMRNYYHLFSIYEKNKDYISMIKTFNQYIGKDAKAEDLYRLGEAYLNKQQPNDKKAFRCFKEALKLKPQYFAPYRGMAEILLKEGKFDKALNIYKKALKTVKDPEIYYLAANLHYLFSNEDEENILKVIEFYRKTIKLKPDFIPAYEKLGRVYEEIRDIGSALILYQNALKYQPHCSKMYRLQIECYELFGKYNYSTFRKIIELYQKLGLIETDNPVNHFELGRYYLLCRQYEQAMKEYNILKSVDFKLAERLNVKIDHWQKKYKSKNDF